MVKAFFIGFVGTLVLAAVAMCFVVPALTSSNVLGKEYDQEMADWWADMPMFAILFGSIAVIVGLSNMAREKFLVPMGQNRRVGEPPRQNIFFYPFCLLSNRRSRAPRPTPGGGSRSPVC